MRGSLVLCVDRTQGPLLRGVGKSRPKRVRLLSFSLLQEEIAIS